MSVNLDQATDIEKFFEVERTKITNPTTKKREEGFKLIKKEIVIYLIKSYGPDNQVLLKIGYTSARYVRVT